MDNVMRGMGRITGLFLLLLTLGACQQHAARPANQDEPDFAAQCQSTRQTTDPQHCQFLHQMRWRIQQNFTGAEGYAGQRCAVTIAWNASRQRYNVLATTGDEAICLKAWQTIGTTPDLPPPPADVNGQFVFNFTPG